MTVIEGYAHDHGPLYCRTSPLGLLMLKDGWLILQGLKLVQDLPGDHSPQWTGRDPTTQQQPFYVPQAVT